MLKKISKYCLSVIAIVTVLVLGVSLTSCAKQSDPIEEFRNAKADVQVMDSKYLEQVKGLCEMALDNEKDIFIKVSFMHGNTFFEAHVLTEDDEYIVYSIKSEMFMELVEVLSTGDNPGRSLDIYLQEAKPYVSETCIYFD